ncbi:hypothetical protein SERLADRAFT_374461 [Serpula lacrymans var. lacrymans S7.9]|uniref:Alpha-type protein kinase domain-containing protein n=1 Tax=Serpula lacrymans var. lacrymans (strain S7.9) TaxID=578457 RepID=F8PBX4_SERL9|nr:uncharacterized protein SERLADRAFT_374461 [Serpula lacrymans var. lacrymans S7.9]EGO19177.1 hypothetical protein SERLADRAFT_374461 [Serpula lacrymans var. lacrymans S7.9]
MTLVVDHSSKSMLGPPRSFKTCHPIFVDELFPTSDFPIQSIIFLHRGEIIAKQWYYRLQPSMANASPAASILAPRSDELAKMLVKANCMYWGCSLMKMVYQFIRSCSKHKENPTELPPPKLPRLCMVYSAIAVPLVPSLKGAVYLLEEQIDGDFVKYINNNNASPRPGLNDQQQLITEFLCFVQHVQYNISHGLAFLSDFQGIYFIFRS